MAGLLTSLGDVGGPMDIGFCGEQMIGTVQAIAERPV